MKCAGIDPGSSQVGIALIEEDKLLTTATWQIRDKPGKLEQGEIPALLRSYHARLVTFLITNRVKCAAVELLSVTFNMDSVRKISYFEGATLLACAEANVKVVSVRTTSARKHALGRGGLKKEQAHPMLESRAGRSLEPDEADAYLFALYAQHFHQKPSPVTP